jgi:hypothetical protein
VLTRLLSSVAAVVLVGVGALLVVELVAGIVGAGPVVLAPDAVDRARGWRLDETAVAPSALALLVGLVALVAALWPRPPLSVPVSGDDTLRWERLALERRLLRRLARVDGVERLRVRVGRRSVKVRATTPRRHRPAEVRDALRGALVSELAALHVDLSPSVSLRTGEVGR